MQLIKKNPKDWQMPVAVNKNGEIIHVFDYAGYNFTNGYCGRNEHGAFVQKFVDNFVFRAILVPDGHYRGRSAAGFHFRDNDRPSINYTMRIAKAQELMDAIAANEQVAVINGGFLANWTFFKQGENYSIGLYKEKA